MTSGTKVLVTGAGSGIGRAVAQTFAASGAAVALLDIDLDAAEAAAAEIRATGAVGIAVRADIADRGSVDAAVESAAAQLGGLDTCINTAGVWQAIRFDEIDDAAWARMLGILLTGTMLVSQACLPHLRAGGGAIVNVTSTATFGSSGAPHYAAAKSGVLGLTQSMAQQLAGDGIRVNAVCPGPTRTGIFRDGPGLEAMSEVLSAKVPLGRMAEPSEIAAVIAFVAGPEASFMTGSHVVVDGGYTLA